MNENIKRHLVSASITFLSSFLTVFGATLALVGTDNITWPLIWSVALTAVRGATKVLLDKYIPKSLGGAK